MNFSYPIARCSRDRLEGLCAKLEHCEFSQIGNTKGGTRVYGVHLVTGNCIQLTLRNFESSSIVINSNFTPDKINSFVEKVAAMTQGQRQPYHEMVAD